MDNVDGKNKLKKKKKKNKWIGVYYLHIHGF